MHYKGFPKPQYVAHIPDHGMRTYVLLNVDNTISVLGGGDTGLTEQEVKEGETLDGVQEGDGSQQTTSEDEDGSNANQLGLFEEWLICISTYDINCGSQQKFWGIYGGVIVLVVIAIALSSKRTTPIPYGRI